MTKTPRLLDVLSRGSIAYVDLVYDYDGDYVGHWYKVAVEPHDDVQIQTIEFTVTHGGPTDPTKYLDPILKEMGWSYTIRHYNNLTGQYFTPEGQ